MPAILDAISANEQVAIVDTNNLDELFENINDAEIISIIDHHKLTGTLKTNLPREIVIQPYASTMTVIFNVMNLEPNELPGSIAGLMLSGIISDTLAFRSPTTTNKDKELAESLAEYLNINIDEYATEMFNAKSDIAHFSATELIRMDSKIYEVNGLTSRVSVLETTNPQMILDRYEEIVTEIPNVCKQDNIEEVYLFAIDILKEEATLLVHNENIRDHAAKSFDIKTTEKTLRLPGIVSRKKQILPALTK